MGLTTFKKVLSKLSDSPVTLERVNIGAAFSAEKFAANSAAIPESLT